MMLNSVTDSLDRSPMTRLQIMAVLLCILLNALDGFDVLSIAFASPGIASDWGISRSALGLVLSMELIGMAVGSMVLGGIADHRGRRPTIMICLVIMAGGMLMAGFSQSVIDLSVYRFITGLGIGGMLASTNAMVAEYANSKRRNMAITFMAGGFPLGIIVGGVIATELLKIYSWRSIFFFGATVTVGFLILVWFSLPESVYYLLRRRPANALDKINQILTRMQRAPLAELPQLQVLKKANITRLFSSELRQLTAFLTVIYFSHIMTHYFFLKWIPKIVVDMGYASATAGGVLVWANVGGLLGSLAMGLLSQRVRIQTLTIGVLLGCSVMITVFAGASGDLFALSWVSGIAGFFTQAAVVGLYALLAEAFPTEVRAGGTGFVIGIGRGGAALGPISAGLLFTIGINLQWVGVIMASGSLLGAIALLLLRWQQPREASEVKI